MTTLMTSIEDDIAEILLKLLNYFRYEPKLKISLNVFVVILVISAILLLKFVIWRRNELEANRQTYIDSINAIYKKEGIFLRHIMNSLKHFDKQLSKIVRDVIEKQRDEMVRVERNPQIFPAVKRRKLLTADTNKEGHKIIADNPKTEYDKVCDMRLEGNNPQIHHEKTKNNVKNCTDNDCKQSNSQLDQSVQSKIVAKTTSNEPNLRMASSLTSVIATNISNEKTVEIQFINASQGAKKLWSTENDTNQMLQMTSEFETMSAVPSNHSILNAFDMKSTTKKSVKFDLSIDNILNNSSVESTPRDGSSCKATT